MTSPNVVPIDHHEILLIRTQEQAAQLRLREPELGKLAVQSAMLAELAINEQPLVLAA